MADPDNTWLLFVTILLVSIFVVGLFLYIKAETLEQSLSGGLIFAVVLVIGLLASLETALVDMILWSLFRGFSWLEEHLYFRVRVADLDLLSRVALVTMTSFLVLGLADTAVKFATLSGQVVRCGPVFQQLISRPYDARLIAQCPMTESLGRLILRDVAEFPVKAHQVLSVIVDYISVFTEYCYVGILALLTSGIPRKVWQSFLLSLLTSAAPDGRGVVRALSEPKMVHRYRKGWVVAVREGWRYYAPRPDWEPGSGRRRFIYGSLRRIAQDTFLFDTPDQARDWARDWLATRGR
jgi:hypothetical protein